MCYINHSSPPLCYVFQMVLASAFSDQLLFGKTCLTRLLNYCSGYKTSWGHCRISKRGRCCVKKYSIAFFLSPLIIPMIFGELTPINICMKRTYVRIFFYESSNQCSTLYYDYMGIFIWCTKRRWEILFFLKTRS